MAYQSEAQLEENLVNRLGDIGYELVTIPDYDGLVTNFRKELNRANEKELNGVPLSDKEFKRVMLKLEHNTVFQAANIVRDKMVLERDDGTNAYLMFLDKYPENNHYQVAHQIKNEIYGVKNRYDVTLLVNGLPLVQIELKRSGVEIDEAINQIDRYRLESFKGLFKCLTMFVVSNGNETRYFANTDDLAVQKSLTFYWTDQANERINNLDDFSYDFLQPARLTKTLTKYTVLSEANKALMVMRPYQIFAVEAFTDRAKNTDKNGYVAHCTGSGKTLTSFKLAQTLTQEPAIDKVFFLIDRKDLDYKTIDDFNTYEKGSVDMTNNTRTLVRDIKDPHKKLIVTTIQKLSNAVKRDSYKKAIEPYRDKKVVFLMDECHRSVFGKMNAEIQRFFKNAQYFGFTGTPRYHTNSTKGERTTDDLFDRCLHQYLMVNAINDHNVLGFNVEYVKTYDGQFTENDPYAGDSKLQKAVYEDDERVEKVAHYIADHHRQKTVNGKYTAILATSSIEMLGKYYHAFKNMETDRPLKIGASFSFGQNEEIGDDTPRSKDLMKEIIADYNVLTEKDYSLETYDAYSRDLSKRLQKKTSEPTLDLLIVVNQYLTGFDSKPTNTLYVDKNMEYHDLVQAFSRTNRVFDKSKQYGNIVCFRDIKKNTDEALRLFNGGQDISGIFSKTYQEYLEMFRGNMQTLRAIAPDVKSIDTLIDENDKEKFIYAFRDLINTMSVMETFVDFGWDKEEINSLLPQQEFEDYKGRYRQMWEDRKRGEGGEETVDIDIDFQLELIQNDLINTTYILNLIRNINYEDLKQKEKDIAHILEEIKRGDNPYLKLKEELLRKFLKEVVPTLDSSENLDEIYLDFEAQEREKDIAEFSEELNLEPDFIREELAEYDFSHHIDKDKCRKKLSKLDLGYKANRKALKEVEKFIQENSGKYAKYQ